jgi:hypothetical protein
MADDHRTTRYRKLYARLLRLYPRAYRERFAQSMEQTFGDLCRERTTAGKGLFTLALWAFCETLVGILRESLMQNISRRLAVWAAVAALLLLAPLLAGWPWDLTDFVIAGAMLFGVGLAYELIARRSEKTVYRVAFGIGLVTAFLLGLVNGAVGIIGNENQPANLLYAAVFAVGLIGSLMARFQPRGMARTLFTAAIVQLSVPVIALVVWPQISWGGAGIIGVFVLNAFFASQFAISALLFRRAARNQPPAVAALVA